MNLISYQERGIKLAYKELKTHRSVLIVSPMRSGKTVIATNIGFDYIRATNKNVLILVHREELLSQMQETFFQWYGIIPGRIDAKTSYLEPNRVYVAMVETLNNRVEDPSFMRQLGEIGMLMIDEAHLSNFKKLFDSFPCIRIGFTATPISAKKSEPLNSYWESCVVLCTNAELMELNKQNPKWGVVPCEDYDFGIVDRDKFKIKGQDFDEDQVSEEFGKFEQIQNTIDAILQVAYNKKLIIYNSSIEHSLKMHNACLEAGFNSRHGDSNKKGKYSSDAYRKDTLGNWITNTPNAILNNVGFATIGTNIPSVEGAIFNYSTKSVTKFWQCIGRPATPFQYKDGRFKEKFILIDTGNNIRSGDHRRFQDSIDWMYAFHNPKKPVDGVSPVKTCPECMSLNYASASICLGKRIDWITKEVVDCGYVFSLEDVGKVEDVQERKIHKLGEEISVSEIIRFFVDKSEFASYYKLFEVLAETYRASWTDEYLDSEQLTEVFDMSYKKATEWFKLKDRKKYRDFRVDIEKRMLDQLIKVGFKINIEEYEIIKNDK